MMPLYQLKTTFKLDMFLGDKFTQNEKVVIIYSP